MKKIPLSKGMAFSIVDDEDYDSISKHKWYLSGKGYACRNSSKRLGPKKEIQMHRVILQTPVGLETDHINGDRLDNRRSNLRACTTSENQRNRPMQRNNTTGFKGVRKSSKGYTYEAQIKFNGKKIYLGTFPTPELAAVAYDRAADKYHGEFKSPSSSCSFYIRVRGSGIWADGGGE